MIVLATPLLETKLYLPRPRRRLVPRPRLTERLNRGTESTLTLVSAPAGFGKTTLLAGWLASGGGDGRSVAWLSLDEADNDPTRFWTYFIAALQSAAPEVGGGSLTMLQLSPPPPIDVVLATLLNELGAITSDVLLVLDDYHLIDASEVQDGMAFLLDHLPPRVHLVIASRADPPFALARLRARGELLELRAAELRFRPEEAAAYLNEVMGLGLAAPEIAALGERTEGWVAALQLAALSLQGRDDTADFIAGFAGDDRYIVDYLAEEVLQRQPAEVRRFLLQTAILDRLSGPLCEAVTGQDGGKAMLEALERGNLFVVPLDDHRRWYRYHHLFADVLRAHLRDEQSHQVPELHRRASAWYEQYGDLPEAIGHALAAEDFAGAARLVELAAPTLQKTRQEATLLSWLKTLPNGVLSFRPVLSALYAGCLLAGGVLEGVESRLADAERWLYTAAEREQPSMSSAGMVVVDAERFLRLPGAIAVYRAGLALALGNVAETETHARRALELTVEDDHLGRGSAAGLLGLAAWTDGDLEEGHRMYSSCMTHLERAGYVADTLGCAIALADIRIAQGRLREAARTYERALARSKEGDEPPLRGTADMYVGLSELARERGDLQTAMQCITHSKELGEHLGLPQNRYRWCVALARIRQAEGDIDAALDLLNEAERLYVGDFFPNVRPVAAMKARAWLMQGRLSDAIDWANERRLSPEDDLSYLREYEHITLARTLVAQANWDRAEQSVNAALRLLERLLQAAEAGGRTGSVIELLLLLALVSRARGATSMALTALTRALHLAEPEGYVRIFVDEGASMADLLQEALKRDAVPPYARRLLGAFRQAPGSTPVTSALREPLSDRELDVLRLLGTDLDGPDIARELVVSLNTMRTHTKNIYSKLGVNSRRAAVQRAEQLGLFARTRGR
jgi:LuxR family maltose regulon positive regulatory protein